MSLMRIRQLNSELNGTVEPRYFHRHWAKVSVDQSMVENIFDDVTLDGVIVQ